MVNLRVVAIGAGIAFILSFVSGLAGGVSFLALLLRAGIGAAVFSGVIAGLMILIERFLPELAGVLFQGADPQIPSEPASAGIDIVVPDEGIPDEMYQKSDSESIDDGLALEVGELTDEEDSEVKPVETHPQVELSTADLLDSMDSLPDLDSFSGSFISTEAEEPEQKVSQTRNSPAQTDSYDPETLAKAVQTLLKKDREGKGNYGR